MRHSIKKLLEMIYVKGNLLIRPSLSQTLETITDAETILVFESVPPHPSLSPVGRGEDEGPSLCNVEDPPLRKRGVRGDFHRIMSFLL
jgi:hypothetical protein